MATAPASRRHPARRALLWRLALLAIAALAFYLRTVDARHVFVGERVLLPGYDTHYHMRRIQMTLANFPHVPAFDRYVNHPTGAHIYWPAGFDLALATVAKLCGAAPWSALAERVCAWAIPVLGLAVVVLTYWLGALWRGRAVGLIAAAIVACLPAATSASAVGRVDHDVAVALLTVAAFASCLTALRNDGVRPRLSWAALAGLLLGLALWMWPAAIVFLLLPPAAFFAHALAAIVRGRDGALRWDVPCTTMAVAAVTVVCVVTARPAAAPRTVSFAFLSAIHVLLALVAATATAMLWVARRFPGSTPRTRVRVLLALECLVLLAAFALYPRAWSLIVQGLAFVGRRGDEVVAQAGEAQPLFVAGLPGVVGSLTWAVFLFPIAFLIHLRSTLRAGRPRADWLIAVWAAATAALALSQRRFAGFLAVPFALCLADLARRLWTALGRLRERHVLRLLLAGTLAAALAAPFGRWTPRRIPPNWELRAVLPVLDWLRTHATPQRGQRSAPAVLAFWHYGHWLTHVARCANISCPFGNTSVHRRGLADAQAVLGARTEAAAVAKCAELEVRYVLTTDLPLPLIAAGAGLDPRRFPTYRILANCLQLHRGLRAPRGNGPLRHFRLVAQAAAAWPSGAPYTTRLFEFVPAARLVGRAPGPGTVRLRIDLRHGSETIRYQDTVRADDAGSFELRVPYATTGQETQFQADGPAHVTWRGPQRVATAEVTITDADVRRGITLACDLR